MPFTFCCHFPVLFPPRCIFFFLMKHPWVGTVQYLHQAVIVIYEAWSEEYRWWVLWSSVHCIMKVVGTPARLRREGTKIACGTQSCFQPNFKIPWDVVIGDVQKAAWKGVCCHQRYDLVLFSGTDLATGAQNGNLSSQLKWPERVLVATVLLSFSR